MADEDEQIDESEIETAEEYRDYHQAEGTPVTRYGEYHDGKAEMAALVVEGDVESTVSASDVANDRYQEADPQTTERAVAKGMLDAVGELADLGALDEDPVDVDTDDDEDDEDEEVDNTEEAPNIEGGGVTVDMDDV